MFVVSARFLACCSLTHRRDPFKGNKQQIVLASTVSYSTGVKF